MYLCARRAHFPVISGVKGSLFSLLLPSRLILTNTIPCLTHSSNSLYPDDDDDDDDDDGDDDDDDDDGDDDDDPYQHNALSDPLQFSTSRW